MTRLFNWLCRVYELALPADYAQDVMFFLEERHVERLRMHVGSTSASLRTAADASNILGRFLMAQAIHFLSTVFLIPAQRANSDRAWLQDYAGIMACVLILLGAAIGLDQVPGIFPSDPFLKGADPGGVDLLGWAGLGLGLSVFACGGVAFVRGEFAAIALCFLYSVAVIAAALGVFVREFVLSGVLPASPTASDRALAPWLIAMAMTLGLWRFWQKVKGRHLITE